VLLGSWIRSFSGVVRTIGPPVAIFIATGALTPSQAQDPARPITFELPVACEIHKDCSVQNYFDHDPGPGRVDHACGRLSYDGHGGTDIRVPDYRRMREGVAVLAAAAGRVRAIRDGMPDVSVEVIGRKSLAGRDAGNSVVIDHGNGWETLYAHLRRESVLVRPGDQVRAGERLGLIGLSGFTEFPHVHFEVRYRGRRIDPFVGPADRYGCGDAKAPLWSEAALRALEYRETGPLSAGFATVPPEPEAARNGEYRGAWLTREADALLLWVDIYGAMAGDREIFTILGPGNRPFHQDERRLARSRVTWFAYSGRKRPENGWIPGSYVGTYRLMRGDRMVVEMRETVEIRDGR